MLGAGTAILHRDRNVASSRPASMDSISSSIVRLDCTGMTEPKFAIGQSMPNVHCLVAINVRSLYNNRLNLFNNVFHSFIHPFLYPSHSFIHSFIHPFLRPSVPFIHPLIHSFIHSFTVILLLPRTTEIIICSDSLMLFHYLWF